MIEQTIFYILGSVFFGLAIVFLYSLGYFWFRILRDFSEMSSDLRDAVNTLKEKVEGLASFFSAGIALVEKLVEAYQKKKKVGKKEV